MDFESCVPEEGLRSPWWGGELALSGSRGACSLQQEGYHGMPVSQSQEEHGGAQNLSVCGVEGKRPTPTESAFFLSVCGVVWCGVGCVCVCTCWGKGHRYRGQGQKRNEGAVSKLPAANCTQLPMRLLEGTREPVATPRHRALLHREPHQPHTGNPTNPQKQAGKQTLGLSGAFGDWGFNLQNESNTPFGFPQALGNSHVAAAVWP